MQCSSDVAEGNYYTYFHTVLVNELHAQVEHARKHNLFQRAVQAVPVPSEFGPLFQFHVPGLREYSLRIELGDVVRLRQLLLFVPGHPFEYLSALRCQVVPEYHAIVWGIDRANELLRVRMDGFTLDSGQCEYLHDQYCNTTNTSQLISYLLYKSNV